MKQGDITIQDLAAVLPISYIGNFTRDLSVAAGSQVVTGIGFNPSSILFINTKSAGYESSWGCASAATTGCIYDNNGNATDTYGIAAASCIWYETNGSNWTNGVLNSMDIDGFTINWTKGGSQTGSGRVVFMAFK